MAGEDDFYANPLKYYYGFDFNYDNYKESLVLVPKGDELEYRDNLILVRMIDLSSNKLSGAIPTELSKLSALRFLNLSRNYFSGEIPKDMGKMKLLESLDLSLNKLWVKSLKACLICPFSAYSTYHTTTYQFSDVWKTENVALQLRFCFMLIAVP
ncbi:hypothetical protein AHAS_Ahas05G0293300 [Arachis hypogaea]